MSLNVRVAGSLLLTATCFIGPVSPARAGLQNSPWPMFHRDAEHGARSEAPISASPTVRWSAALTDSAEFSSPAIDIDGNIYLGDLGDRLHKFDAAGNLVWSFNTGGNVRRSSPAIADDGTTYIGAADGNLYAVNPDGTQRWAYPAGGAVKTAPAVGSDGSIYFGADDGKLYSLTSAGTLRWTFTAGDTIRSSPALVSDSLVVFGSNDGSVYALRTNGTVAWSGATGGPVKGSLAVGQGDDIFVPSQDRFLYSLRRSGNLNWVIFTGRTLRTTPAIGVTGKIYLTEGSELWAYHDEGDTAWVAQLGGESLASPIVYTDPTDSTETVIVGADDGMVYGVSNGIILWTVPIGAAIHSSAAIGADGTIYVGANDGRLYALGNASTDVEDDTATRISWTVGPNPLPFGAQLRLRAPDDRDGVVTFVDPGGKRVAEILLDQGRASWNGRDDSGQELGSGVYFYRWQSQNDEGRGRVVLVR